LLLTNAKNMILCKAETKIKSNGLLQFKGKA